MGTSIEKLTLRQVWKHARLLTALIEVMSKGPTDVLNEKELETLRYHYDAIGAVINGAD